MAAKPILSINPRDLRNPSRTLGLVELMTCLMSSGLFEITNHSEVVPALRGDRATLLLVNGKRVYLDLWEYGSPTYTMEAYNAGLDVIIKLQHKNQEPDKFLKRCKRKNILTELSGDEKVAYWNKMVPWTFFPSRMMKKFIYGGEELPDVPVEEFGFFCGKMWRCRNKIAEKLADSGIDLTASKQEIRAGRPLSDAEYIRKMLGSKYGIILHGRGSHFTEAKNRREIDYTFLSKPILMNYEPLYYNPLVAGQHFIRIDENTEFDKLEELYNVEEIARAGHEWYQENASPTGAPKVFLQIMKDKGIV